MNKLKLQHVSAFTLPANCDNTDIKLQKYTFNEKVNEKVKSATCFSICSPSQQWLHTYNTSKIYNLSEQVTTVTGSNIFCASHTHWHEHERLLYQSLQSHAYSTWKSTYASKFLFKIPGQNHIIFKCNCIPLHPHTHLHIHTWTHVHAHTHAHKHMYTCSLNGCTICFYGATVFILFSS